MARVVVSGVAEKRGEASEIAAVEEMENPLRCNGIPRPRASTDSPVDPGQAPALPSDSMRHLNAIAATSTVRFWWRGRNLAARWRD